MNILAIDTSLRDLSLALSKKGKLVRHRNFTFKKDLAKSGIILIERFLKEAKVSLKKLDGVVIGLGPGSFTGLRIGVSMVKALAYSLKIPVIGISSLDAIAAGLKMKEGNICVLMDARRQLFYAALYRVSQGKLKRSSDYLLSDIDTITKNISTRTTIVGNGVNMVKEKFLNDKRLEPLVKFSTEKYWKPQAKELLVLAGDRFKLKRVDDVEKMLPLYLYPENCQVISQ